MSAQDTVQDPTPDERVPPNGGGRLITAPRVFVPAAALLVLFVGTAAIWPDTVARIILDEYNAAGEVIDRGWGTVVAQELAWWYIALATAFVFFSLWVAFSHLGNTKLGQDDDEPEFSTTSWFAMLFAAGMGIGLMFWGVAEPMSHFFSTPPGLPGDGDAEKGKTAMNVVFLHWGLHAWAIYVVVGLAIAYSVHRRGNPISIRWALEPVLGNRIKGFWGDVIDVIAVLGTLFGVATSLGLGVSQISAGMDFLGWVDDPGTWLKVVLIIVITGIAAVSVVTGVDKGIKILSNLNMGLAVLLVVFVMIVGPTVFILSDYVTQVGSYIQNFFNLSFNAMPFQEDGKEFLGGWTTFYWGWWMSWAPFVGVFIARISKGRTVREFVVGVLAVPTLITFLWFAVFGGTALYGEIFGDGDLTETYNNSPYAEFRDTALFHMLDNLPWAAVTSVIAIALIVIFFVTSSDSGSFVVDMLASGGDPEPPRWSRIFWAVMEGTVAAVLLIAGTQSEGDPLAALQMMAILLALPFSIVMVLMCIATGKSLLAERRDWVRRQRTWLAEQVANEIQDSSMMDDAPKATSRPASGPDGG